MERWRECISIMKREFLSVPGLAVEEMEPDSAFCNPRIAVSWQAKTFPVKADVIARRLATGRPHCAARLLAAPAADRSRSDQSDQSRS